MDKDTEHNRVVRVKIYFDGYNEDIGCVINGTHYSLYRDSSWNNIKEMEEWQ